MNYSQYVLLAVLILISACQTEVDRTVHKEEYIELAKVKITAETYEKGEATFAEKNTFNRAGQKLEHIVVDVAGTRLGNEKFIYEKDRIIRADYFNSKDTLLSYYMYSYNDKGQKSMVKAHDAQNDELLRVEEFGYDDRGFNNVKKILTADMQLDRSYHFVHDLYGNETKVTTLNSAGDTLVQEDMKITQYDEDKKWLEKWGFHNGKPITYRIRSFEYPKN